MDQPVTFAYRAFLSYSHQDTRAARRLHKALEGFRIDKDLAGRPTPAGPVPKTLRPIFRDRDDFAAGHSLTGQTLAALQSSPFLIVVCSPAAANSHYVNEEVRLYKALGRADDIVPVIVDGEPGHPEKECFPASLRFELNADGTVSDRKVEVLAADLRETGDGFDLALAKVAARLLGLGTDEVYRRAERARKRSARLRNGIIGLLAFLTVAAIGSAAWAYHLLKTNEEVLVNVLTTATEIVDDAVAQAQKIGVPKSQTLALLGRADKLFQQLSRLGRETPEIARKRAWMLIQFGRLYESLGDTTRQRDYAAEAERIMRRHAARGGAAEETALGASFDIAGDNSFARGDISEALEKYRSALEVAQHLVSANPDDHSALRNLSVSHENIGDVLMAAGEREAALVSYRASHAIFERLAASDPGNAEWQRDLSVSHENIGDVLMAAGEREAALKSYRASLAIAERLAASDPGNAEWQRDLSVSHEKIGDVLLAAGERDEALKSYRASLAIAERLAASDPGNAGWQRDLSVSHEKIGDVLMAAGEREPALKSYRASLVLFERLAASDPGNAEWQYDLGISNERIGDVLMAEGKRDEALAAYRKRQEIISRLAASDPGNAGWQRDLSVSHDRIGDVLRTAGERDEALVSYRASLAIRERLAASDPGNAGWQRDLSFSYTKLGEMVEQGGDRETALQHYEKAFELSDRLARLDPGNVTWQQDARIDRENVERVRAALKR